MPPRPTDIVERIRYGNARADSAAEETASTSAAPFSDHLQPSTSALSPSPSDDVEPDDEEDVVSTQQSDLSAAEHAALIVQTGQISFDAKLGIFTVNGTTEPRVVQLSCQRQLLPRDGC